MIEDEGVHQVGQEACIVLQAARQSGGGRLTYRAIGVVQMGVDLLQGQRFTAAAVRERKAQRCHGFIEQANEGGAAGDGFLFEDFLFRLLK